MKSRSWSLMFAQTPVELVSALAPVCTDCWLVIPVRLSWVACSLVLSSCRRLRSCSLASLAAPHACRAGNGMHARAVVIKFSALLVSLVRLQHFQHELSGIHGFFDELGYLAAASRGFLYVFATVNPLRSPAEESRGEPLRGRCGAESRAVGLNDSVQHSD